MGIVGSRRWLRVSRRTAAAAVLCVLAAPVARAQPAPGGRRAGDILSGEGPATPGTPVDRPYLLGWSVDLTGISSEAPRVSPRPGDPVERPAARGGGLRFGPAAQLSGPALDPRTGWVYVALEEGRLFALQDGRVKWSAETGGEVVAPSAVFDESVAVGTADGVLLVFNKVTGQRRARAILGESIVTRPVVQPGPNGTRIYVGSSAESLFAVDLDPSLQIAQKAWRAHRDAPTGFTVFGFATPVVTPDTVYAGFADGTVAALDPATGAVRWEKALSPPTGPTGMGDVDALAFDGRVLYAASYSAGVYALDAAGGATLWRTPVAGVARLRLDRGMIYAGSPGMVHALRSGDGRPVWTFRLAEPRSPTAFAVTPELLAVSTFDGPIYFIDRRSGSPAGILGTGDDFSGPVAADGALLYGLSNRGRVYSLGMLR